MAKLTSKEIESEGSSHIVYYVYDKDNNLIYSSEDQSAANDVYRNQTRKESAESENNAVNTTQPDTNLNNNPIDNSTTDNSGSDYSFDNTAPANAFNDNAGGVPGDAVSGTAPINNSSIENMNPSDIIEDGKSVGAGKGLDFNTVKNKGVVFPIIRINDHICA